jgi:hypothetical protein
VLGSGNDGDTLGAGTGGHPLVELCFEGVSLRKSKFKAPLHLNLMATNRSNHIDFNDPAICSQKN